MKTIEDSRILSENAKMHLETLTINFLGELLARKGMIRADQRRGKYVAHANNGSNGSKVVIKQGHRKPCYCEELSKNVSHHGWLTTKKLKVTLAKTS